MMTFKIKSQGTYLQVAQVLTAMDIIQLDCLQKSLTTSVQSGALKPQSLCPSRCVGTRVKK